MPYIDMIIKRQHELGLTNSATAEKCDLPLGTISRIVSRNTDNPSFYTMAALAKGLGLSLDELAGISNASETASAMIATAQEELRIAHEALDTAKKELSAAQNAVNKAEEKMQDMQAQLDKKDYWLRRISTFASVITFLLVALLAIALFIDFTDPSKGFFYLDPDFEKIFSWFGKTNTFPEIFRSALHIIK